MSQRYLLMLCLLLNTTGYAKTCFDCAGFYWGISGSFGASQYQNAYGHDGRNFIGRMSLEAQYTMSDLIHLGLETGIQNGNTMRLNIPKSLLDELGGEPVQVMIKPPVDLLITLKFTPFNSGFFAFTKGGIAYRHLQVDRNEVNDVTQISPEIQTGLGYGFNDRSYFFAGYQHLFGQSANYRVNPVTEEGFIDHIPSQDSLLIGVTVLF